MMEVNHLQSHHSRSGIPRSTRCTSSYTDPGREARDIRGWPGMRGGEGSPTPSLGPPFPERRPGTRRALASPHPSASRDPRPPARPQGGVSPPRRPRGPPHAPAPGWPARRAPRLAGRRAPTRCPPRGAARPTVPRAAGPGEDADVGCGPRRRPRGSSTRARVLLTNCPGARGGRSGRRRGSQASRPARPWPPPPPAPPLRDDTQGRPGLSSLQPAFLGASSAARRRDSRPRRAGG